MLLRYWSWPVLRVMFSPNAGSGWLVPWPREPTCGWAWFHHATWHVLRAERNRLLLQIGSRIWPVDAFQDIQLQDNGAIRSATLRLPPASEVRGHPWRDGGVVDQTLCITYRPPASRLWNRSDPTFDALDEELADFFVKVRNLWRDPRQRIALAEYLTRASGPDSTSQRAGLS